MPNDEIAKEGDFDKKEVRDEGEANAEEFKVLDDFPSEEKIMADMNISTADASVSPSDPDFLLFALPLAIAVDSLDPILEIAGYFVVIPKVIGIIIDFVTVVGLGGWLYWRTEKIAKSKKDYLANLRGATQKNIKKLSKLQKMGGVSPEVFNRYMRLFGKQMGKIGNVATKVVTKTLGKVIVRGGLVFLVEVFALVINFIPFWVIMVISALREE